MNPDFDEVIDQDALDEAERARLRGVHELLLAAGPPPELPERLSGAPHVAAATVLRFPNRRGLAVLGLAAALAVAAAGGYLVGDNGHKGFTTVREVALQGKTSFASIRVGPGDGNGNWPLQLSVTGLPKLTGDSYYELMLTKHGKPAYPCGGFVMRGNSTTLTWNVPYKITGASKWIVMVLTPKPGRHRSFTGPVVLT